MEFKCSLKRLIGQKLNVLIGLLLLMTSAVYADCPPSANELCNYQDGTFFHLDNYLGIFATRGYGTNSVNSGDSTNSASAGAELDYQYYSPSGLWLENRFNYTNLFNMNYANDSWGDNLKVGYAFQPIYDYWTITPYISGGVGSGQLWYSYDMNTLLGAGLRTEVAFTTRSSIYLDDNLQYIMDSGNFANDFNQQFNATNGSLDSTPYSNIIEVGYKQVINCNTNIQVFYRYMDNIVNLSGGNPSLVTNNNYATNMVGIGVTFYTGTF